MTSLKRDEESDGAPVPPKALPPAEAAGTPAPQPPVSVRSLLEAQGTDADVPAEEPQAPPPVEATVTVDGTPWTVRVAGRGRGGASMSPVPYLLLRFYRDPDGPDAAGETLVVARALAELTPLQLEAALRAARPLRAEGERPPLFPEIAVKGNRRDQ